MCKLQRSNINHYNSLNSFSMLFIAI